MPLSLSKTDICNGALSLIGQEPITDLDTDESEEADQCRIHYLRTRNRLLEEHPWKWAQATTTLTEDETASNPEYDYSYQLPDDCLQIVSSDLDINGEPYFLEGRKLITDQHGVTLTYTREEEQVGLYSAGFITALEHRLAARLSFALTKDLQYTGYMYDLAEVVVASSIARESQQARNDTYVIDHFLTVRNQGS